METEKLTFLSKDGKTQIHGVIWMPGTEKPTGILQITHGMVEYIERYQAFAQYMNEQGYIVVGHDHLGHGESVTDQEDWGYFAPEHGSDILVEDMHTLHVMAQERFPDLPYFMLGHSMGSFLLRKYLYLHGENLRGAIIMGTGTQPDLVLRFGKALTKLLARFRGWHFRSRLVNNMAFAGNDRPYAAEKKKNSWLTKDAQIVDAYNNNPKCSFVFTLNGFYNLFDTIWDINRPENMAKMPKKLPLFFVSGEGDPVGAMGKGVKSAYDTYEALGMADITWKLYPDDRHEILNELDKEQVYEDIYHWMEVRLTT